MASPRSLENKSEEKSPLPLFQNLALDLIVLKDDIELAKHLQYQDQTALYTLGKFRTDLANYKKQLLNAHDEISFEKIKYQYVSEFAINTDIKHENENYLVAGVSYALLLCGTMGVILDMMGQRTHTILFGALSVIGALGVCVSRMMNSISHIEKKDALASEQFKNSIDTVLTPEKKVYYQTESYRYLQTRMHFFKKNREKSSAIMRLYSTPYEVMRLMLDCYQAIKNSPRAITSDMTNMLDATFGYYFYTHEEPYHQAYKDLLTEYMDVRIDPEELHENEKRVERMRPRSLSL